MTTILSKFVTAFASFKLSVAILFGLFVLTWLGTLAQTHTGLHAVQKMYFDSWYLIQPIFGPINLPLPGAFTLMILLVINLTCGGIIRLRRRWDHLGILITHLGIALLLIAGFVKVYYADEGPMQLFEGQEKAEYMSYYAWEIQLIEPLNEGGYREYIIDEDDFVALARDQRVVYRSEDLPFELLLSNFMASCQPAQKGPMFEVRVPVVDGFFLQERRPEMQAEFNIAGCYLRIRDLATGREQQGILWGRGDRAEPMPFGFDAGGRRWGALLRKKRWPLPFSVKLDYTEQQRHPGTTMARSFLSDVVVSDGSVTLKARIQMNEPLRYKGYILFQSGWGDRPAKYTVLAVVRNPSDQWPLYACIIITLGLVIHFSRTLLRYIQREARTA